MAATNLPLRRPPWQHGRRMAKGAESHDEGESSDGPASDKPVATSVLRKRDRNVVTDVKFYWPALVAVVGLIVQWVDMRHQVSMLHDEISRFEQYVNDRFDGKTEYPTLRPLTAPSTRTLDEAPSVSVAPPSLPAQTDDSAKPETSRLLRSIPSNVPTREPPVCVTKSGHRRIPCESATKCFGPEAFKPEFFQKMRDEAGVSGQMLVCDETAGAP